MFQVVIVDWRFQVCVLCVNLRRICCFFSPFFSSRRVCLVDACRVRRTDLHRRQRRRQRRHRFITAPTERVGEDTTQRRTVAAADRPAWLTTLGRRIRNTTQQLTVSTCRRRRPQPPPPKVSSFILGHLDSLATWRKPFLTVLDANVATFQWRNFRKSFYGSFCSFLSRLTQTLAKQEGDMCLHREADRIEKGGV